MQKSGWSLDQRKKHWLKCVHACKQTSEPLQDEGKKKIRSDLIHNIPFQRGGGYSLGLPNPGRTGGGVYKRGSKFRANGFGSLWSHFGLSGLAWAWACLGPSKPEGRALSTFGPVLGLRSSPVHPENGMVCVGPPTPLGTVSGWGLGGVVGTPGIVGGCPPPPFPLCSAGIRGSPGLGGEGLDGIGTRWREEWA